MREKGFTKGMAICVAFCVIGYLSACLCTTSSSCCHRSKCKRRAIKVVHAVSAALDSLSDWMHH